MKIPLKICFIATYAYPLFDKKITTHYGGTELQLYFLATEIAKDHHFDVSFIVGDFGQKQIETIDRITIYKLRIVTSSDSSVVKLKQAHTFFSLLRKINADIYMTSAANSMVGIVNAYTKLYKKVHIHRTASTIDVNKEYIQNQGVVGRIYKYGLDNAQFVLTQSEDQKKLLRDYHKKDSVVFKNVFPVSLDRSKAQDKKGLLWVGKFEPNKHPEIMVDIAKKFPTESVIMVCPFANANDPLWISFQKQVSEIKNVTLLQSIHFEKIQEYFDRAKLLINTSDFEGFPNIFIQAGIGGTPIVSLHVNPDNFLHMYKCGFVTLGNREEMEKKIELLLSDAQIYKEFSDNIYKYVKQHHNLTISIKQFKKIIQEI